MEALLDNEINPFCACLPGRMISLEFVFMFLEQHMNVKLELETSIRFSQFMRVVSTR